MVQKSRIRVGAVSFLNTKPLIHTLSTEGIQLYFDVPSRLAELLEAGLLDVAIIPIIEYFRASDKGYKIIPNISIASHGPVQSIQLFSYLGVPDVRMVALDTSSRTSRALLEILLADKHDCFPDFMSCSPSDDLESVQADGVLLIGDAALKNLGAREYALDLGADWHEWTQLPFVYACWVARDGVELGNIPQLLMDAKESGIAQIPEIVRIESKKLGLPAKLCWDYLTRNIRFDLGDSELAGLKRFYELAVEYLLAPAGVPLRFVE